MRNRYYCPECNRWFNWWQVRHYPDDFCYCSYCYSAVIDKNKATMAMVEDFAKYTCEKDFKNNTCDIERIM